MGKNEQSDQQQVFWDILTLFWGPEKVKEWREAVLGPQGTEVPSNLLCLMTLVHTLWGKSCFALKPLQVADDRKSMQVQFCWLRPATYRSQVPITEKPCLPRNLDCGPRNIKLWNCLTEKKICSGEIIEIRTDDPELRPLPSAVLLQMQWILHRVLAMSGAADAPDEELDTDSESDVASWEADDLHIFPVPGKTSPPPPSSSM
ncbi:hypothetical protein NUU61_009955 [Penicillium alfredii]|uniref:HNH nuclease domain-containing protein n=1 Tax=Penicillium alfredii TaxID=1506179 RepID=A0A9W9JU76_9EURO|nr:uncharacterized protein NUU61_009955 [Penicillium alfredii]KAJ5081691.1 hypothetical protein NUU61_009955 [Penicillium alfredii]